MTVDPDDYPVDEEGTFVVYFMDDKGNLKSETTDIETYNSKKPWPLLLINTFEHLPEKSLRKPNSGAIAGPFIALTHIDIKHENDPIGNEEFEIFIREDVVIENMINYCPPPSFVPGAFNVGILTDWTFDGHWVTDLAGNSRWLRDFNTDEGGYHEADNQTHQPIAMIRLDSEKKGLTPIEDDQEKGEHHNTPNYDPCVNEYRFQSVRADRWDLGYEQWDNLNFHVWPTGSQDDVYTYSGVFGFTYGNTTTFPEPYEANNADLGLKVVKRN